MGGFAREKTGPGEEGLGVRGREAKAVADLYDHAGGIMGAGEASALANGLEESGRGWSHPCRVGKSREEGPAGVICAGVRWRVRRACKERKGAADLPTAVA